MGKFTGMVCSEIHLEGPKQASADELEMVFSIMEGRCLIQPKPELNLVLLLTYLYCLQAGKRIHFFTKAEARLGLLFPSF